MGLTPSPTLTATWTLTKLSELQVPHLLKTAATQHPWPVTELNEITYESIPNKSL